MLENKDFCDYDTCVALEEFGFPIKRIKVKGEEKNVPILLYEAEKWLREKEIMVYPQYLTNCQTWMCMVYEEKKMLMRSIGRGSYNEVLNEGIKEAVKILKEK